MDDLIPALLGDFEPVILHEGGETTVGVGGITKSEGEMVLTA